jgi:hypothetical protein
MTTYVCPRKDIVCGDRPENWCASCPKYHAAQPSPPAGEADLRQRIMELPCEPRDGTSDAYQIGYLAGHRDARHAAAALVAGQEGVDELGKAWEDAWLAEAIQLADKYAAGDKQARLTLHIHLSGNRSAARPSASQQAASQPASVGEPTDPGESGLPAFLAWWGSNPMIPPPQDTKAIAWAAWHAAERRAKHG